MCQAQMGDGVSRNPPSEKYENLSVSDAFNWHLRQNCSIFLLIKKKKKKLLLCKN